MSEASIKRAERRAKAIDLLGGVCTGCNTTDNLAFDHINNDRTDNRHLVSQLLQGSWIKVLQELDKCQLLCVNCHAKKPKIMFGRMTGQSEHGTLSFYNNHSCRCSSCRRANADYRLLYKRRLA